MVGAFGMTNTNRSPGAQSSVSRLSKASGVRDLGNFAGHREARAALLFRSLA